jgi:recombination protein RecA
MEPLRFDRTAPDDPVRRCRGTGAEEDACAGVANSAERGPARAGSCGGAAALAPTDGPQERVRAALASLKSTPAPRPLPPKPSWSLPELAGRLVEIHGAHGGVLSLAARLVHDAQCRGETTAWVLRPGAAFFPPDFAAAGVDLASLIVVRAGGVGGGARAADVLLRSGAFGLVVLELGVEREDDVPLALQSRWLAAARAHDAALLCVSEKPRGARSLGSLVSLCGTVAIARDAAASDAFTCTLHVEKDKRRAPGWRHVEICHGPLGLR